VSAALIAGFASILVAFVAYFLNNHAEIVRAGRRAHLERINRQLQDLYGPLLVLTDSNERTWDEFKLRYLPNQHLQASPALTEEQEERWRNWLLNVFLPSAQRMRELIISHGDLIIEDEIPAIVLEFCAHVASYSAVVSSWTAGKTSDTVLLRHPGSGFSSYVRVSYGELKARQATLIARGL
jgi:hypothetical protein